MAYRDYPLFAVADAVRGVVGWAWSVLATVAVASWLGVWIGTGDLPSPSAALLPFGWSLLLCLFYPPVTAAVVVTGLAWYLPTVYAPISLRIGAVLATFLTWSIGVAIFTGPGWGFW